MQPMIIIMVTFQHAYMMSYAFAEDFLKVLQYVPLQANQKHAKSS